MAKKASAVHPARRHTSPGFPMVITPHTKMGLERIIFFSDAVMAIAITLLALEIRLPENVTSRTLAAGLWSLMPHYASFLISFFVIGLFWISHHRIFEYIETYNRGVVWINLIFLLLIAFIPFPTAVLGRFPGEFPSVVFYAAVMILLALVRIWFWWYVYYRAHLTHPDTNPKAGPYEFIRAATTASMFAISIAIAFWSPAWAMNFWLLLLPVSILSGLPYEKRE